MKNNTTTYLTKQGLKEIQTELDHLIKTRELRVAQLLGYEQIIAERRIIELKALIKSAVIIKDVDTDKVSVGAKIKLKFLKDNKIRTYSIVGTPEADPFENKISNESPIAQAILGKKVNDIATVALRFNKFQVRILNIST